MGRETKVLVADDSQMVRFYLQKLLQDNVQMAFAEDGEQTIEQYMEFKPHIILLDIRMPRMDGLEVISYLRESANDNDVYILVMTGEGSNATMVSALNLGANDFLPKPINKDELQARLNVAERQVALLESSRDAYSRITRELDMVSSLQGRLLPGEDYEFPDLDIQSVYFPSGMASGDYYDYFMLSDRVLRFVVADVSGHGARAAFIMAMVRTVFRVSGEKEFGLEDVVSLVNSNLCQVLGSEKDFVTLLVCDLDLEEKKVRYVNAGHCPGMMLRDGSEVVLLPADFPVLGFFDLDIACREISFNSEAGIFLYTDGFYEWNISEDEIFGDERFQDLARNLLLSGEFYLEELKARMEEIPEMWPAYRDDLTALWVHTNG